MELPTIIDNFIRHYVSDTIPFDEDAVKKIVLNLEEGGRTFRTYMIILHQLNIVF